MQWSERGLCLTLISFSKVRDRDMIKTKYRDNMRTTQNARKKFLFSSWNFNNLWKRCQWWVKGFSQPQVNRPCDLWAGQWQNWELSAIKGCDLSTRATYLRVCTVIYKHDNFTFFAVFRTADFRCLICVWRHQK